MLSGGALSGVHVLDLSRLLPGPYCSMILADHGAEVIAIEDHRFLGDSLFFDELNRNKRHMTLNLKCDEGKALFYKLAENADVVLEGFRPGVMKRLGVDYESVSAVNPGIIYCSISGYGQTGVKKDEPGHDINYLSTAGLLDLIGEKNNAPAIPGIQIADIAGGSMQAAVGILLALYQREKSGRGQYIDISMTDGVLGMLTLPRFLQKAHGEIPERSNTTLSHRYGCYNTYVTKDKRYIALGAVENRFWKKLCEYLGKPEYGPLQYDKEHRLEIISWLRNTFETKARKDWDAELAGLGVCYSPIQSVDEILESELFKQREMICDYVGKGGKTEKTFGIPIKLSETPGAFRSAPADFGEHTAEILQELGYDAAQIKLFVEKGVV